MEQVGVEEAVCRELHFVIGLKKMEEDPVENRVVNLVESIQQLQ
jgi:hypothetical protein